MRPTAPPPGLPPVRRHRPTPAQQLADIGRRAGVGGLVVAALAVGGVADRVVPTPEERQRPYVRTGAVGEPVSGRQMVATVVSVRGAGTIVVRGRELTTGGIWILVRVKVAATIEPVGVAHAAVRDGQGRTYQPSGRLDQPLSGGRFLQPGIPVQGELVFEVPTAVASSLVIELSTRPLDQRMDSMAEVRLPITPAQVDEWLAAKSVAVTAAEVVR